MHMHMHILFIIIAVEKFLIKISFCLDSLLFYHAFSDLSKKFNRFFVFFC